jgi:hypothetical protein
LTPDELHDLNPSRRRMQASRTTLATVSAAAIVRTALKPTPATNP